MAFDGKNTDTNSGMWEWQEEECWLQRSSRNDVSHCLWDEVNPNEDSFMYMLQEQTPIKDCVDVGFQVSDVGDIADKQLEECTESSQMKRRRMLQFTSDTKDIGFGNEQFTSVCQRSEDGQSEQLEWNSQWNWGVQDDRRNFNCDGWDQQSEGWLVDCLNGSETHSSANEMHDCIASGDQVNVSEFCNVSAGMETDLVQETPKPTPSKIFKGKQAYLKNPTKLATSVAYPFALIKPCGVQGDVTLKDINQRIHAPPPSTSKHVKDESPSLSYPTSAFSGKPVIVKTKIRTEGGKGSITIMRTKG